jgi:hypothetical protein
MIKYTQNQTHFNDCYWRKKICRTNQINIEDFDTTEKNPSFFVLHICCAQQMIKTSNAQ